MTWTQVYTPLWNNLPVSALAAALPVIVLLGLLAFFHARAHVAALAGLAAAILVAVLIYHMPTRLALLSAVNGALYGLFPIGWIVLCAIFAYDITVHTGQFDVLKQSIARLADDPRIQALLIAFSFGAFIEGAAGFGTPVAISAAMLIGLGFKPLQAAGLALIGNTAPVAYGALGTPIIALARVTNLPIEQLSAMAGRQLPLFSVIVPFWLIWAMAGLRGMLQVWPACLTAGLSFAIVQFLVSNYHGPWVVDIAGAAISIASLVLLLRFWQPKQRWRFPEDPNDQMVRSSDDQIPSRPTTATPLDYAPPPPRTPVFRAYLPWLILSLFVFAWGLPQVKTGLNKIHNPTYEIPGLHNAIYRDYPVVAKPKPEEAKFSLNYLSATGTALLLSAVVSGLILGLTPLMLLKLFARTLHRVRWSLLTIAAMLALGFTTRFGGLDATMGLAFASTGFLFPFFSPLLGWLGVALTGSDTSSNVLFGNLQQITAERLGVSPILAAASNSSGGVMGKMIDAQSIVVASVATNQHGGEGQILRYVFFHSLALATLVGLLVLAQAYWLTWMIPR
jgi:lactate permease